jgi:hypothetical protein
MSKSKHFLADFANFFTFSSNRQRLVCIKALVFLLNEIMLFGQESIYIAVILENGKHAGG